jgi:hypothetical protein
MRLLVSGALRTYPRKAAATFKSLGSLALQRERFQLLFVFGKKPAGFRIEAGGDSVRQRICLLMVNFLE